jgi:LPS-assembly lipoprotein
MSSLDTPRRLMPRLVLVVCMGLATGGCLRPLYGPTASGQRLDDVLAAIKIEPVRTGGGQERLGSFLRNELAFALDGSGSPRDKRYLLSIQASQRLTSATVDTATGRADSAILFGDATYTLSTIDEPRRTIASGKASASTSYDRNIQRFTTVRASRDAEIRLARNLSEQVKIRLAAALQQAN